MKIKTAEAGDFEVIYELNNQLEEKIVDKEGFRKAFDYALENDRIYVLEEEGEVVGEVVMAEKRSQKQYRYGQGDGQPEKATALQYGCEQSGKHEKLRELPGFWRNRGVEANVIESDSDGVS